MEDIEWGNPKRRRSTPAPPRTSCVVCGLRADCLICKECANDPAASIAWLDRLPVEDRVSKAIEVLKTL